MTQIDGRRRDLLLQRQRSEYGFDATGGAQQVTGHRLGRADRHAARVIAEAVLDGDRLGDVAERCGGSVRVDVVDFAGIDVPLRSALTIARDAPSPSSLGAVM